MLMSKKRYNVNKRITRFIFAGLLCNKRIQNFLILLYKSRFFSEEFTNFIENFISDISKCYPTLSKILKDMKKIGISGDERR